MKLALIWVTAFFKTGAVQVRRTYYVEQPLRDIGIITDASPWGLGGVLVHVPTGRVLEALTSALTEDDAADVGSALGDPAGQAIWEFLAIVVAIFRWGRFFARRIRVPLLKSDSMSALGAARKLASPAPALNWLAAELSIRLECLDAPDCEGSHLPGKLNDLADYYSRLQAPNWPAEPAAAKGLKVRTVVRANGRGFVLP